MDEEPQKKSIRDAVMEKIETSQEKMRPKWHFALRSALFITGLALGILMLLFVVSLIFFALDRGDSWFLPAFGLRGIQTLLSSLPWLLILFGMILIVLLEVLARRFSFVYRRTLLFPLCAAIIVLAGLSFAISRTPLHQSFNDLAAQKKLPVIGSLYRNLNARVKEMHVGIVNGLTSEGFEINDRDGDDFFVIITNDTSFPSGVNFRGGDRVTILGRQLGHTINAAGVNIVNLKP